MTLAELIIGHHPLSDYDGSMLSDLEVSTAIGKRPVPLEEVRDRRWKQLLRGLLTRDPRYRWGSEEVQDWLAGGFPDVAVDIDDAAASNQVAFQFVGLNIVSLSRMGVAMADNWDASRRLIMGPSFNELLLWADRLDATGSVAAAHEAFVLKRLTPDAAVAALIIAMAPRLAPSYRGEKLSLFQARKFAWDALEELDGSGSPGSRAAFVNQLFESGVMAIYGSLPQHSDLSVLDSRWRELIEEVHKVAAQHLPAVLLADVTGAYARYTMLQEAVNELTHEDYAASAFENSIARELPWFDQLCLLAASEHSIPALYVAKRTVHDAEKLAAELQRLATEVLDAPNGLGSWYDAALDAERIAISEIGTGLAGGNEMQLRPIPFQESRFEQILSLSELTPLAVSRLKDLAASCRVAAENHKKVGEQAISDVPPSVRQPREPSDEYPIRPQPSTLASAHRSHVRWAWISGVVCISSWIILWMPQKQSDLDALGWLWITLTILGIVSPLVFLSVIKSAFGDEGRKSIEREKFALFDYERQKASYLARRSSYLREREEWELEESERDALRLKARETRQRENQRCAQLEALAHKTSLIVDELSNDQLLTKIRDAIRVPPR